MASETHTRVVVLTRKRRGVLPRKIRSVFEIVGNERVCVLYMYRRRDVEVVAPMLDVV